MRLWADEAARPDRGGEAERPSALPASGHPLSGPRSARRVLPPGGSTISAPSMPEGARPTLACACNRHIKFGALWRWAREQGAEYLATGHYARRRWADGALPLARGADRRKDQSYVLYALDQETLAHALFPLGDLTKDQVRAAAQGAGLPAAQRPESQEICFIPDDDYRDFLTRYYAEAIRPGPIYDTAGREIGQHRGLPFYTVGQRKGMGIAAPEPLYVIEIDPARNRLVVGPCRRAGPAGAVGGAGALCQRPRAGWPAARHRQDSLPRAGGGSDGASAARGPRPGRL